ncbi:MAG: hypothetical protein Q9168_007292 [Polycauliona sp. 1 TL-2023]
MQWDRWSGFMGDGSYVILNKRSLTCLDLKGGSDQADTSVRCLAHTPHDWAQQWRITKQNEAGIFSIENRASGTVLSAADTNSPVVAMPKPKRDYHYGYGLPDLPLPTEALWVIDKGIYGLEPGNMAL